MDNNYLIHFGIKGMRWGVRRYQNKDGSLTPAGKKRYNVKTLYKGLTQSKEGIKLVFTALISKIDPKDYGKFNDLAERGKLFTKARLKKNLKDESVDLYMGNEKTPTIRTRLKDGNSYTVEFLDKNGAFNVSQYYKWRFENREK